MKKTLSFIIEDISDGQEAAFAATCPELRNSVAMGDDMKELFAGIRISIECARDCDIEVARKPNEFMAVLRDYQDSAVFAPSLSDLRKGVESAIKLAKSKGGEMKFMTLIYKKRKLRPRKN